MLIVFSFFSLPEVPPLVDVPCLSAQLDDSLLTILKSQIFNHGTIASRPPVQIEELIEKPGSILVRWCKVGKYHFKISCYVHFLPIGLCFTCFGMVHFDSDVNCFQLIQHKTGLTVYCGFLFLIL